MAVDRRGFLRRQLHELLDQENGLGAAAAEMEFLVDDVIRDFLPFPVDLLVPLLRLVQVYLAQVVEQGGDRHGFIRRRLGHQESQPLRVPVNVDGMLAQPARIAPVVFRAGRRRIEIRLLQPAQQVLQSFPADFRAADRQEFLFLRLDIQVYIKNTPPGFGFSGSIVPDAAGKTKSAKTASTPPIILRIPIESQNQSSICPFLYACQSEPANSLPAGSSYMYAYWLTV